MRLLIFFLTICSSSYSNGQIILIDPGHGGDDHGARTTLSEGNKQRTILEKDLVLTISEYVHQELKKEYTSFLTRSLDRNLSLQDRASMAQNLKADLFISIHLNSADDKSGHGFEIFYLDNHNNAAVTKVEKVENKNLDNSDLIINQILIDLVIEKTVVYSKSLASTIHQEVFKSSGPKYKLKDRGVKAGLFYVLALSKCPSVLIELGFLSHPQEKKLLMKNQFQKDLAKDIANGIKIYLKTEQFKKR